MMRTAAAVVKVVLSLATAAKIVSAPAAVALALLGGGCAGELDLRELLNLPPMADAGEDQVTWPGFIVPLNGSGSRDLNHDALTYCWTQTGGPTAEVSGADQVIASFVPAENGTYVFCLAVSDEYGAVDECEATVTVDANASLDADQIEVSDGVNRSDWLRPTGVEVPAWDGTTIYGGWFGQLSQDTEPKLPGYPGRTYQSTDMSITIINAADPADRKVCIVFQNRAQLTFTNAAAEQTILMPDGFTQTFTTSDGGLEVNDDSFLVVFDSTQTASDWLLRGCGTFNGYLLPGEDKLMVTSALTSLLFEPYTFRWHIEVKGGANLFDVMDAAP